MSRESRKGGLLEDLEKLRELQKPTISKAEAETCQRWAGMDGATAFHLIERHAANWADTRLMMEAWLRAQAPVSEIEGLPLDASMDNVQAAMLGKIVRDAIDECQSLDRIDRGLILVRLLREAGFSVIRVERPRD